MPSAFEEMAMSRVFDFVILVELELAVATEISSCWLGPKFSNARNRDAEINFCGIP
jgi:hypothetical protein